MWAEGFDFDFQLQIDSELLPAIRERARSIETEYVLSGGPFVGNDEIGVAFADFSVADAGPLQSGFVDQEASVLMPRGFLKYKFRTGN